MSLDLLNTIGTLLTVAIVSATAIAALIQLRHLRAGNQINAILTIGDKFQEPSFRDGSYLVRHSLPAALEDPQFRAFVVARQHGDVLPDVTPEYRMLNQAALLVGNAYEEAGNLIKNGVVDEVLFLDQYCSNIVGGWKGLQDYTAFCRAISGDIGLWDNFEYLTVRARDFLARHPTTYPNGVPRIALKSRWSIPARN
jgi:hypothetical protein